ncbi:MAG: hypothetical protein ABF513_10610, partial [Acetobacter malorum]
MNHLFARSAGAPVSRLCSARFRFSFSSGLSTGLLWLVPAGALLAVLVPPVAAHAQSATQPVPAPAPAPAPSVVRQTQHAHDINVSHDTMPARLSDVIRTPPKTPGRGGFWDNMLLPPLTSRPEAYGQPQSLELKPLPTSLMHQGPWGVFNANTGAAAGFGTVAYYAVSRWAEDWSSLRDKRNRIDWADPLKYIPLNNSGSIYLTLSG